MFTVQSILDELVRDLYQAFTQSRVLIFVVVQKGRDAQHIRYIYVVSLSRAGKPPVGLHLDVLKNDKLIQVEYIALIVYNSNNMSFL